MVKNTSNHSMERVLLQIALDLNARTPTTQHYQKLVDALQQVLPCDACVLLILNHQQQLIPVAMNGLSNEVLGRSFLPELHPRLSIILESRQPVRFPEDSTLPNPFDGYLSHDPHHKIDVHACMGCSLYVEDTLVGVLTLDAQASGAFDDIEDSTIETFASLAAGIVRNISLFEALNKANYQQKSINKLLDRRSSNPRGAIGGD